MKKIYLLSLLMLLPLMASAHDAEISGIFYYLSGETKKATFTEDEPQDDEPQVPETPQVEDGTYYWYTGIIEPNASNIRNLATGSSNEIPTWSSYALQVVNNTNKYRTAYWCVPQIFGIVWKSQGGIIANPQKLNSFTYNGVEYDVIYVARQIPAGGTSTFYVDTTVENSDSNQDDQNGNNNNDDTDGSLTPPTGKSGLVYTGAAQNLITAGSSTTGTMQYSLDGTNYSTAIPQGTDAKEYTVYYKVVANAGYNDVDPASFKVTISPKPVSSPTITLSQTSYTYDGTAKEPTVTVKDGDATISASEYAVSYKDNTEVGTATVTITDKDGGNYTVSGSTTFSITSPETLSIIISVAKQSTYCSDKDLDFTNVEGLKAYTATGYHRTNGTIWLTRIKEVPAGEGILLIGDEGEYKVPYKATTAYYVNMLVGTLEAKTINETNGEYTNYYLSNGSYGVGFYKVNGTQAIGANRAYLPLLKDNVPAGTRYIGLGFDDGEGTTGINGIKREGMKDDAYYTLQGQRVMNPGKGLYIKNGKKVVIR